MKDLLRLTMKELLMLDIKHLARSLWRSGGRGPGGSSRS